jgi:hypothetical protein
VANVCAAAWGSEVLTDKSCTHDGGAFRLATATVASRSQAARRSAGGPSQVTIPPPDAVTAR